MALVDELDDEDVELDAEEDVVGDELLPEEGWSLIQGGSPLLEKSLRRRNEMVSRMMEALSNCDVMAGGRGNILASS